MASTHAPLALAGGVLSIDTATAADAGVLAAADWQAFNSKVSSLSGGAGIDVGGTAQAPTVAVHFGSGGAVADGDSRMSDARAPLPGSSLYIQNGSTAQNASLNVSGNATIGGNLSFAGTLTGDGSHLSGVPSLSAANVQFTGAVSAASVSASGAVTAGSFSGSGSSITNLNANNIGSGTVSSSHLPLDVAYYDALTPQFSSALSAASFSTSGGLTVSGTGGVTISGTGTFSGDGSGLLNVPATQLTGSVGMSHLPVATSGASSATALVRADDARLSDARAASSVNFSSASLTGTLPDTALSGNVAMTNANIAMQSAHTVTSLPTPVNASDAAPKSYVDSAIAADATHVLKSGDTMTGKLVLAPAAGGALQASSSAGVDPLVAFTDANVDFLLRPSGAQIDTARAQTSTASNDSGDLLIENNASNLANNYVAEIGFAGLHGGSSVGGFLGAKLGVQFTDSASGGTSGDLYVSTKATANNSLAERLRVTAGGNVGIGTPTPASALDVNGTIRGTQFGAIPVSSACPGTTWSAGCATSQPGTGVLAPGASISFDINSLELTADGNVGLLTVFLGDDPQPAQTASSDNSWVVAIHAHGRGYNQYNPLASRSATGYAISFGQTTTFTNNTSAPARYIMREVPLLQNTLAANAQ